jgi:hypothetical protein
MPQRGEGCQAKTAEGKGGEDNGRAPLILLRDLESELVALSTEIDRRSMDVMAFATLQLPLVRFVGVVRSHILGLLGDGLVLPVALHTGCRGDQDLGRSLSVTRIAVEAGGFVFLDEQGTVGGPGW